MCLSVRRVHCKALVYFNAKGPQKEMVSRKCLKPRKQLGHKGRDAHFITDLLSSNETCQEELRQPVQFAGTRKLVTEQ